MVCLFFPSKFSLTTTKGYSKSTRNLSADGYPSLNIDSGAGFRVPIMLSVITLEVPNSIMRAAHTYQPLLFLHLIGVRQIACRAVPNLPRVNHVLPQDITAWGNSRSW